MEQIQMQWANKQKMFLKLFLDFWNTDQSYHFLKKKMILIAYVFSNL